MMDPQATLDTMHRLMIQREWVLWKSSRRAIHLWRLRKIYREAGWPVPAEIESYLDDCTDRLCAAQLTSPDQVANAFGLGPKGRRAAVTSDELAAAEHVFGILGCNADRRARGEKERSLNQAIGMAALHLNEQCPDGSRDAGSYVRAAYSKWLRYVKDASR